MNYLPRLKGIQQLLYRHSSSQNRSQMSNQSNSTPSPDHSSHSAPKLNQTFKPRGRRRRIKEPFLPLFPFSPPSNCNYNYNLNHTKPRLITRTHPPKPSLLSNRPSSSHPISQAILNHQQSSRVLTTAQLVDEALKSLLIQPLPNPPPMPNHHAPPSLDLTDSSTSWSSVYLTYLQSSTTPTEFARRLEDLIIHRLPRHRASEIVQLHSRHPSLRGLVSTDSYNALIRFAYIGNRYDQARTLLAEMVDRGLERNLRTYELIMCSYQALDKPRGVELTLKKIKSLGLEPSPEAWVSLLSIRPRQRSRLRHLDSMEGPSEAKSGFPVDRFLAGWRWGTERFNEDGKAVVSVAKRLMNAGHWSRAYRFIDTALKLSAYTRTPLSAYWASEFLHVLVYGLYNAKQEFSKRVRAEGVTSANVGKNEFHDTFCPPPIPSAIQFVEDFIDIHGHAYAIKTNPRILLNCLRVDTCLPPSELETTIERWLRRYGLDESKLGSRLALRFAHVTSSWLTKALAADKRELVEQEYNRMIKLWNNRLEKMIQRGPVDGKRIRGLHAFYTSQSVESISIALKRVSKLGRKIGINEDPFRDFIRRVKGEKNDEEVWKDGLIIECDKDRKKNVTKGRAKIIFDWSSENPGSRPIRLKAR
ncbi:hypothetical protein CROQUDRAFT_69243 [Cronartium quercuum f. sp. fusiforme G11]|uniref:Pentatricopeptide repeat-containing protein n=1 Tax=Cronartium quercuum f. sp. fusiforme G11 TaxID=708437 RepID=A0A9P6T625_9BASI|nr:hypothetical protein CROQUDRAFT_69243 [Cronartium quercuum f. sp. fusiforme G11]